MGQRADINRPAPPGEVVKTHKKCPLCGEEKKLDQFGQKSKTNPGLRAYCFQCEKERMKRYKALAHVKKRDKENLRKYSLAKYGLTIDEYDRIVEKQQGRCALCNKERKLVVDHCHKSGHIRELICTSCNLALGHFHDDIQLLQRAIDYLRRHSVE